jgi:hypothetical protein
MNVCKKGQIALYSKPKVYSTSDYPKKYGASRRSSPPVTLVKVGKLRGAKHYSFCFTCSITCYFYKIYTTGIC